MTYLKFHFFADVIPERMVMESDQNAEFMKEENKFRRAEPISQKIEMTIQQLMKKQAGDVCAVS